MDKTIKIKEEDYKILKDYSRETYFPMWYIIRKALKRYFGKKLEGLKK